MTIVYDSGSGVPNVYGYTEWKVNGELHREDGPAIINKSGSMEWYKHGKIHRDEGPAAISSNGDLYWHIDGKLHNDNGPAAIYDCGSRFWYKHDKRHREDGPAVESIVCNSLGWYREWWYEENYGLEIPTWCKFDNDFTSVTFDGVCYLVLKQVRETVWLALGGNKKRFIYRNVLMIDGAMQCPK